MSSIFKDTEQARNAQLNRFYEEVPYTALAGATTIGTAVYIGRLAGEASKLFLDNQCSGNVYVALSNPYLGSLGTVGQSLLCSVSAGEHWTVESVTAPNIQFPAGTGIWLYAPVALTDGMFRVWSFPG